jgi:glycosyltransferase 2 family protein
VRRHRVTSWLGVLVSIVALAAVAWWISRQESPRLPESGMGYAWLGLALLLTAVTLALRGWRWHRILQLSGVPHRSRDALGLTLVAYMGNNVLPARGGELLKIGLMGERTTARRREVLGTVLVERSLDAAVLALLFAALTWTGVDGAAGGDGSATIAAVGLGVAAASLAGYMWLRRRGRFERFAAAVRPVAGAFRLFTRPAGVPPAVASLVIWCLEGLTFLIIARAIGVELELPSALAVVVLASLFAAIPAAPGYVGTFDAGILVGLSATGVVGGDAVGVLLLARFVWFVPVTLVGLGVLVFGYGGLRRPPADDEELLPEQPPRERGREVASGQRGAGG